MSPQQVRWVRSPSKFSLQMLGARPVDSSDPPGRLDRTWRDDAPRIPWFGRVKTGLPASCKLIELRGELDVGHLLWLVVFLISDWLILKLRWNYAHSKHKTGVHGPWTR